MKLQTAARYRLLDELRGLDLISMMLYHGMWDVVFLFGVAQKWYTGRPGFVWQQSICWNSATSASASSPDRMKCSAHVPGLTAIRRPSPNAISPPLPNSSPKAISPRQAVTKEP